MEGGGEAAGEASEEAQGEGEPEVLGDTPPEAAQRPPPPPPDPEAYWIGCRLWESFQDAQAGMGLANPRKIFDESQKDRAARDRYRNPPAPDSPGRKATKQRSLTHSLSLQGHLIRVSPSRLMRR
jgi:hypothetical protein